MAARQKRKAAAAPASLHRISAVAQQTQLSEHTLRIWERRYGSLSSHRSDAGYRLYTNQDIEHISTLKQLLDSGYAIGDIAALSQKQLARLLKEPANHPRPGVVAEAMRRSFIEAIERFDVAVANDIGSQCALAMTPLELVTEFCNPVEEAIGRRWHQGTLSIAQEHAASTLLRGQLASVLRAQKPRANARIILATTPADELHELGALGAAVIAAGAGERAVYLGPNTPTEDIAQAAKDTRARVVLLSLVCLGATTAHARLLSVRRALSADIELWAGGGSIDRETPGVEWISTHQALAIRLGQLTTRDQKPAPRPRRRPPSAETTPR